MGVLKRKKKCRKHLPTGTGPHTVGCVDLMSERSKEGIFIRLYYPTHKTDIYERQMQWPRWLPRKQYMDGYMDFKEVNKKVFGKFFTWIGGDTYVPVLWHAPILRKNKFPVIIMSHGIGANRTSYSTICVDLASYGFVVAMLEHRDGSASMTYCLKNMTEDLEAKQDIENHNIPHGREFSLTEEWLRYIRYPILDDFDVRNKQVHHRQAECSQAVDLLEALNSGKEVHNLLGYRYDFSQFAGRLDMNRVAVAGHSFGGATVIATLAKDQRFKVGVAMDSWMLPLEESIYEKVKQPLLMINSETFQWKANVRDMLKLNSDTVERKMITLRGTCHQSTTDFQFIARPFLAKLMGCRHHLSPKEAMSLNDKATLGFLWKHLDIPNHNSHRDILDGRHHLVIRGTNLDLDDDTGDRMPNNSLISIQSIKFLCLVPNLEERTT